MKFRTYDEASRHISSDPWAAQEIADRSTTLQTAGYKILPWNPGPRSPAVINLAGLWCFDGGTRLIDHPYELRTPDGRTIYVTEPYGLSPSAVAALGRLATEGWRVEVRPELAIHYPGKTVAVWIEKQEAA